jgi:lipopolysaccharide/colanic/teichoic acid biosynthesis glycosyltransferase
VGLYTELFTFEKKYFSKKSQPVKGLLKIVYYLYYRAFPKIPYLNKLYNLLSAGNNKVLSRAEVWGRLAYAGFDVENEIQQNDLNYFVARKELISSDNPNPSFYPIITLNRVSVGGSIVKIHKVRSMYPYSEFIQKKVFEMNSLSSTGKFNDDFRITVFGKIFRKYWIDELPQIIDWFTGEIKLVGIRAMSQHYFSLYRQSYKDKYYQVKPGIFSPIFDEKTSSFEEIQQIEEDYLDLYLQSPLKADIIYFFKTFSHILKGVRSK